jgi:hypothetical protein
MSIMVELDERRRLSLGKVGHHSRYLVREERDGTLIFEPAVVLTEFEARVLSNDEIVTQLRDSQADSSRRRPRTRHTPDSQNQPAN